METEHNRLRREGYLVVKLIKDEDLEEELIQVSLNKSKGIYTSVRIVPSTIAVRGEEFKPEKESHLVYARYNPDHPIVQEKIKQCQKGPVAGMLHLEDEEGIIFPLNQEYSKILLNLASKKK